MKKEELMKPRYKMVANYPKATFQLGTTIIQDRYGNWVKFYQGFKEEASAYVPHLPSDFAPEEYPAIFQKLKWWEDRTYRDLPEYLKCIKTPDQKIMPNMVLKITEYFADKCGRSSDCICVLETDCFIPATEEEFTNCDLI